MERNEISEMETDWKGSGKYVSMERKVTKLEKTWNRCGEEKEKMGKDRNRMAIVILHCGNPYEPDSFIGCMGPLSILVFHLFPYCFIAVFGVICHSQFDDSHC